MSGLGLKRLQHLVLWVSDDHHLGLFEQKGVAGPDDRVARMYHAAWEVGDLTDLARARRRLVEAGALVGSSNHGGEPVALRQGSGRHLDRHQGAGSRG